MAENINLTLSELEEAISQATLQMKACCGPKGSKTGSPPSTQAPEYGGIDDEYEDAEAFFDARCNACNSIFDTILGVVVWLGDNGVDWKLGAFGGLTVGITFMLLAAGPVGWGIAGMEGAVTGIVVWLITEVFDFDSLATGLGNKHAELVKALYNASDVPTAKANFLTVLEGATPTPTEQMIGLLSVCLTTDLLNNILDPRSDTAIYQSPDPIDCGGVTLALWTFPTAEGWAFRDDSTGTYSAAGVHVPARGAWEIELTGLGTGTGPLAKGTIYKTGLSVAVDIGNSIQMDFGPTSDGVSARVYIYTKYADTSEYWYSIANNGSGGTIIYSLVAAGTIAEIEVSTGRNWSNPFVATRDFLEVRVQ